MADATPPRVRIGPGLDSFRGESRLERALLPYLREPTLWPVLAVLLAHAVAFVAPMLVLVWREAHAWSILGLSVLGVPSLLGIGLEIRDRRRPRLLSALIVAAWACCGAGAVAAVRVGLL
jgi:hypothetical protein